MIEYFVLHHSLSVIFGPLRSIENFLNGNFIELSSDYSETKIKWHIYTFFEFLGRFKNIMYYFFSFDKYLIFLLKFNLKSLSYINSVWCLKSIIDLHSGFRQISFLLWSFSWNVEATKSIKLFQRISSKRSA
jgi:hypothetical protein